MLAKRLAPAFHAAAFAAAYVLNAWVQTAMSPFAIMRALAVAVLASVAVCLLGSLVLRDPRRGGLLATAMVGFVIFGRDIALVAGNAIGAMPAWQTAILTGSLALLFVAAFFVGRSGGRRLPSLDSWTRALNVLAAVLVVVIMTPGIASGMIGQTVADLDQGGDLDAVPDRSSVEPEGPDIYLILLDGYPRADVLADQFGFDNTPFLDELGARGLEVAPASHSNYTLTEFTLLSMFNMDLLPDVPALKPVFDRTIRPQPMSRRILNENATFDALREHGYLIVGLAGTYEDVALRQADIFLETEQLNELEWQLLSKTFLLDVLNWALPNHFADQQRAFIDAAFDQSARVANDRRLGPRFLLAHVFAPRSPLVFGPSGEPLELRTLRRAEDTAATAGLTPKEFAERLVGQVEYVNTRTLQLIDTILHASPEPPVIIVLSDHGSRSRTLDPASTTPDQLRERFGTLFAAYTPGHPEIFPADVTPAQVMGRLLEAYFGLPFRAPGGGIFASEQGDHVLTRLGDAPPTPAPATPAP